MYANFRETKVLNIHLRVALCIIRHSLVKSVTLKSSNKQTKARNYYGISEQSIIMIFVIITVMLLIHKMILEQLYLGKLA